MARSKIGEDKKRQFEAALCAYDSETLATQSLFISGSAGALP